ncbi:hypothetical protein ANO11243_075520 [Dothideomycetidae sp. 11243]|nr:hypothetical protein ANO11243_075520 [fungal sp. No.11243]
MAFVHQPRMLIWLVTLSLLGALQGAVAAKVDCTADVAAIKLLTTNPLCFCNFYLSHASPIEGFSVPQVSNACTCIIKKANFCDSAGPKKLSQDQSARPFCQSILALSTVTLTKHVTTTPTITKTVIYDVITATTTTVITPSVSVVINNSTVYPTYCGTRTRVWGRDAAAESEAAPVATPTYLTSDIAASLTAACKCLTSLPAPVTHLTLTTTASASTVVVSTTTTITETVDLTVTSGTVVQTSTSTVEAIGIPTPFQQYDIDDWDFELFANFTLIPFAGAEDLANCTCNGVDNCVITMGQIAINQTCGSADDCNTACAWYNNIARFNDCAGTIYDPYVGTCTLTANWNPLLIDKSCAVPNVTDIILSGVAGGTK